MSKYIIKNCPCFVEGIAIKGNVQKTQTCNNHKIRELTYCQDCTDCVMKQIVELCRKKDYFVKRFPNAEFSSGVQNSELAFDILKLLDIHEVE